MKARLLMFAVTLALVVGVTLAIASVASAGFFDGGRGEGASG